MIAPTSSPTVFAGDQWAGNFQDPLRMGSKVFEIITHGNLCAAVRNGSLAGFRGGVPVLGMGADGRQPFDGHSGFVDGRFPDRLGGGGDGVASQFG
jgi:hypothetical protein